MQAALELRHRSQRTVEAHVGWAGRFVAFHRGSHPLALGARGVEAFFRTLQVGRG
jgi:hypothetical protein